MQNRWFIFLIFLSIFFISLNLFADISPNINILNPIIKIHKPSDIKTPFIPSDTEKGLPSFGPDSDLPSYQERQMGKAFIDYIRTTLPILHDAIVNEYLTYLGYRLVAASPKPGQPYHFFVVNQHDINAFSGPNGYVGVYSGLILETKTEGELAGVLAHEIAHESQRHMMQLVANAKQTQWISLGSLLAAIAVGVANPMAGVSMAAASSAGSAQHMINFIRSHEKEADRIGIQILAKAGFDPRNMPDFFKRMAKYSELNTGEIPAILRTHPVTEERLSDAENRCNLYPKYPKKFNPIFPLIQARVAVALSQNSQALADRYQQQLKHLKIKSKRKALIYAYSLALLKAHDVNLAHDQIEKLIRQDPDQLLFRITEIDIDIAWQHYLIALKNIKKLYHDYPDSFPILLRYAHILLRMKQFNQARMLLEKYELIYQDRLSYLNLLSKAQGYSGRKSEAYKTRAKICLINGNIACARDQLEMAYKFAHYSEEKRGIKAKLDALKKAQ